MNFFLPLILFIFQNLLLAANSLVIAKRYLGAGKLDLLRLIFVISLCFLGLILLPQIILGIFGQLNFFALLIFHLIITAFVFWKWGTKYWYRLELDFKKTSKTQLLTALIFLAPITILVFVRFLNAFEQIPVEYDNLAYHLPFVVEWLQTGQIMPHYYSAFAGPLAYYPSNFELIDLFVILPFGRDYLVNFINFPFFVLTGLAFFAILRRLKISTTFSTVFTALFLSMPVIMRQVGVPLVDLLFTYTFLLAIYFLIDFLENKELKSLLPLAFSLGLFAGTKYLGLVYGLVLVPIILFFFIKWFWQDRKQFVHYSLYFILFSILGGGFWYIRNFIDVGNPIFPVDLSIAGYKILTGYGPISDNLEPFSLLYNVVDLETFKFFVKRFFTMVGVQGLLLPIALICMPLIFLLGLFKKKKNHLLIINSGLLFILQIIYFYLYFKSPYSFNNLIPNVRYALMYLVLAFMAIAYAVSYLKSYKKIILPVFFVVLLVTLHKYILYPPDIILNNDKILFDFNLFSQEDLSHAERRQKLYKKWYGPYPQWHGLLKAAEWFNADESLKDAKIAYTGFNFHYPLFGRDLQSDVDYVNINDCLECRYKEYALEGASIRRDPSYEHWLSNLRALKKEYVVVDPTITEGVYNHEFEWMQEHTEQFELVFNQGSSYIFKVK